MGLRVETVIYDYCPVCWELHGSRIQFNTRYWKCENCRGKLIPFPFYALEGKNIPADKIALRRPFYWRGMMDGI